MTDHPYADGCPNCVASVEDPAAVSSQDGNPAGVICHYRCQACGHQWSTGWQRDQADQQATQHTEGAA